MTREIRTLAGAIGAALCLAAGASAARAELTIPAPTGPHAVGERSHVLLDPSRIQPETGEPRPIPVRVWYPAKRGSRGNGPRYLQGRIERRWEEWLEVPAGTLTVDTRATQDAPYLRHRDGEPRYRGVILLLPGYLSQGSFETSQAVNLASHGYVVLTTDHPDSSYAVVQPGDGVIQSQPASIPGELIGFSERLRDVRFILHRLDELVPGPPVRVPRGIMGHSMGGAVSAAAVSRYPSLRAGLDFDGSPLGDVVAFGLTRPFAFMLSSSHGPDPFLDTFRAAMRAPHPTVTLDVLHWAFTDFAVLAPQIVAADPSSADQLDLVVPTGTSSDIALGERALQRERSFVIHFFDRHLRRHRR